MMTIDPDVPNSLDLPKGLHCALAGRTVVLTFGRDEWLLNE